MRGRPLWFLGGILAGWTGLRMAMLWPADAPHPAVVAIPATVPVPTARPAYDGVPRVSATNLGIAPEAEEPMIPAARRFRRLPPVPLAMPVPLASSATDVDREPTPDSPPPAGSIPSVQAAASPPLVPAPTRRSRLSGDIWLVGRPSGGDDLAFGQLGGAQGGARVIYALDAHRRTALSARVSAPLRRGGAELGVGVDLRPTTLPIHLLIEERVALDTGAARPAVTMIAGGAAALPGRARLDAYAQGGAVWRRGGFIDAAAVIVRPVLHHGGVRVELGGGAWGAAQRRVARFDLGPAVAVVAPTGGATLRVQLDYRVRVAGHARPGSGPALTLGGSF